MKLLSLILAAIAFTILLITLYPFRQKYDYPQALPTPTPKKYTCPTTEWIDCLPGPGTPKPQCQPDYLNWATVNCPDFKGAAL